jgi:molybdenum cofactor biosynthesis enzyme MoaA
MLGVEKIRIMGGEPLLRKFLDTLIERLARLRTPEGKDVEIAIVHRLRRRQYREWNYADTHLCRVDLTAPA